MASVPVTRKDRVPCRQHLQGNCTRGAACRYLHADKRETTRSSALTAVLRLVFEKQSSAIFEDNGRILNLSNLAKCPDLEKMAASISFDQVAFCDALCEVIRDTTGLASVSVIRLDDNGIKSLHYFCKALERADLHNGVRALSVANNAINTFEFIKHLKPLENLREVILTGNPIADHADYRTSIRKQMPQLEGLDGEGINRPPLALPWPKADEHDPAALQVLQAVESALFSVLENGGSVDSLSGHYADDAIFSLVCGSDATVKAPTLPADVARRNQIVRDFVGMKMAQSDRDNNAKQVRTVKTARGRTDVCSALRSTLYPRTMYVRHQLASNAEVTALQTGIKAPPLHAITFHGTLQWRHKEQPEDSAPVTRHFDRSLMIQVNESAGTFCIYNDAVTLRPDENGGEPLWSAQGEARCAKLAEEYKLPTDVVHAIVAQGASDQDVDAAAKEIAPLGPELFTACVQTVGDITGAVTLARVHARTQAPLDAAFAAMHTTGGDLEATTAALLGSGGGSA